MKRRDFLCGLTGLTGIAATAGCTGKTGDTSAAQTNATNGTRTANETATATGTPDGGTYFVSPDGDDSASGRRDDPFGTLDAAVHELTPGDTVYLRGGVYRLSESVEIAGLSGEPQRPITIAGYQDERPVFRFDGPMPGGWDVPGGVTLSGVSHLVIRNLTVRNSPSAGIEVTAESTDNLFADISVHHNNLGGFGLYDQSERNVVRDITAANNYDPQNSGFNADGVAFSNTRDNTIENGRFFYNSDDGLDLWNSRSITVRNCVSWSNGRGDRGAGNGFKLGGEQECGGHEIARNVAYQNRSGGFMHNDASIPMRVFHNTAWRNRYNFSFYTTSHELVNNISLHGEVALGTDVNSRSNTWNLEIDDPEFAGYLPTSDQFLHLSPGSPCIDAGAEIGVEYAGEAPDLGAYEFDPSTPGR